MVVIETPYLEGEQAESIQHAQGLVPVLVYSALIAWEGPFLYLLESCLQSWHLMVSQKSPTMSSHSAGQSCCLMAFSILLFVFLNSSHERAPSLTLYIFTLTKVLIWKVGPLSPELSFSASQIPLFIKR